MKKARPSKNLFDFASLPEPQKPDGKATLTPKLRFPEFREAPNWSTKPLGELGDFSSGGTPSKDNPEYWNGHIPWISASSMHTTTIAKSDHRVTSKAIGNGTRIAPKGSFLILVRGSMLFNRVPMGIAEIDVAFNQDVKALAPNGGVNTRFLLYFLSAIESQIQINETGIGAGKIDTDVLKALPVPFPTPPEQQKIAECLSSVDELIAAEARKLDALKTHKKGLMQQLFPREGETQPRLRFPEFQDAGEWVENKLISLSSEPLSNGVFNDPKKVGTGYKLINVSDMYIETTIDESRLSLLELSPSEFEGNQVITGDIFFTRSSLVKSGIAVSNIYLGSSSDVTYDGHLIRFRSNNSKVIPVFAHYIFKTALIRAQLIARGKTATMTTIGQADVASVILFYPDTNEQQRIADCLTSLDDLIAAQTQKLSTLKTHKKGLMQQLFPSAEN